MPPERTTLGAIDAGSNAIRMVVAELGPSELIRIEAERVPVRLGHGAFTRGELDDQVIDQAVAAFVHFRDRFDHHGVAIYRAVGTSAVRNASNRDVLLHRLYHEAGIELEVIDGEEEARLVRKSVVHSLGPTGTPPRAILDLGGGSLEVNLRYGTGWRGYSLPVGTVRLMETFGLDGAIAEAEAGMVRRYTATLMHTIARGATGNGLAAATGGNAEALAKIVGDEHPVAPSFELAALEKALPSIVGVSVEGRMEQFGVKSDRAEVLGIAALVFATVARQLGIQRLVAPGVGIREAMLLELAETAREEQTKAEGAPLLHDVGEVVNQRGHHKHSEYMIRWGRIPGLDDASREMVALLARTHRKDGGRAKELINESWLTKEQRQQVRRMSALLRIADALDSEHRSRVEQVVATRMGDAIVLDLVVRDGPSRDDAHLLHKADLFRDELGMDVRITVARPVQPATEPTVGNGTSGPHARPNMS